MQFHPQMMQVLVQQANHCVWYADLFHWYVQGYLYSFLSIPVFSFQMCYIQALPQSSKFNKSSACLLRGWISSRAGDSWQGKKKVTGNQSGFNPFARVTVKYVMSLKWVHRVCLGGPWNPVCLSDSRRVFMWVCTRLLLLQRLPWSDQRCSRWTLPAPVRCFWPVAH